MITISNDIMINVIPKYFKCFDIIKWKGINRTINKNVKYDFSKYDKEMTKIFLKNLHNLDKLKLLIKIYPNIIFDFGDNFVYLYCSENNLFDTYKYLDGIQTLENKKEICRCYSYFIINKNLCAIKWFIEHKKVENIFDHNILELIFKKKDLKNYDCVKYFIDHFIDINNYEIQKRNYYPFIYTFNNPITKISNIDVLKLVLKMYNIDLNNYIPEIIKNNKIDVLKYLIKIGYEFNINIDEKLIIQNLYYITNNNDIEFLIKEFGEYIDIKNVIISSNVDMCKWFYDNYKNEFDDIFIELFWDSFKINDTGKLKFIININENILNIVSIKDLMPFFPHRMEYFECMFENVFNTSFESISISFLKQIYKSDKKSIFHRSPELLAGICSMIGNIDELNYLINGYKHISLEYKGILFKSAIYNNQLNVLKYLVDVLPIDVSNENDKVDVNIMFPKNENDKKYSNIFYPLVVSHNKIEIDIYEFLFNKYHHLLSQFENSILNGILTDCSFTNDTKLLKLIVNLFDINFFNGDIHEIFYFSYSNECYDVPKCLLEFDPRFIWYMDYNSRCATVQPENRDIDEYIFRKTLDKEKYFKLIDDNNLNIYG